MIECELNYTLTHARKRVKLDNEHLYEHITKLVEISCEGEVTMLCNQEVQTDRTIHNNKPDIIILDNEKGTWMLIDAAIPGDKCDKQAEKSLKYKDLITEIQHIWNVKTKGDGSSNRSNWNHFKILQRIL
jgi:hypothetical protein